MGDHEHPFAAVLAVILTTVLASACGSPASSSVAASVPVIADVSLVPASESVAPATADSVEPLPSIDLPAGEPSIAPITADYTFGADDLAAFAEAYRAAFPDADIDDASADAAGALLCTYLMHQADASLVVEAARALAEADFSEPGYTRDAWVAAFGIANEHYCSEFIVDFESTGG